ncbi:MAG: hydrogenase nickel incorporation protein HypB [Opitutaceae bacterium]|jgi:hydrogenase nickel incorporation protein HypB
MCTECGCGQPEPYKVQSLDGQDPRLPGALSLPHHGGSGHVHTHADGTVHSHAEGDHPHEHEPATRKLDLGLSLLAKNDRLAERNRGFFLGRGLLAVNLVSSPGSGKTALLERTLDEFGADVKCAVIVGDLETDRDAQRLHRPHVPVAQITTGMACHLDAEMVARGVEALGLDDVKVLFIENVGNLVCPASFDLGETLRVVLLSTTEGEDKPLKYPPIFKSAQVVILTKTDLTGVLGFDRAAALENLRRVAPQARILELSSRSGEGMRAWYDLLRAQLPTR